jgi:ATP-dependent 26S proteasome regulatory subunit
MDIKEMIKFQMISQLGGGQTNQNNNSSSNFKEIIFKFMIFLLMSMIDDIIKVVPKLFNEYKNNYSNYFTNKVKEKLIDNKNKQLIDTSVNLNTRHEINIFNLSRIYQKSDSDKNNNNNDAEESNSIVDALIAFVSKLNNIPTLKLINNGKVMMTYKDKPMQIFKDIFLKIDAIDLAPNGSCNSIKISLLSNNLTSSELAAFVKNIHIDYLETIKNSLGDKIYYFDQKSSSNQPPPMPIANDKTSIDNHKRMIINTSPKQLSFTMAKFYSNKQFSNIYGEEVRLIEKRIKFFINNKDWYDSKGIPYQIGLLLSGLPGAGKTSIIRAIANMTKRHIVNVNFANITTATQLKNLFYSDKINVFKDTSTNDLQSYFIPIEQRLYILEEIDAIGDIVKQRTSDNESIQSINDELTLMEILTVLDGTMEIPGRMVIMTSNHPEFLDKALIRPGRIDVNVNFGYATKELITEMFSAYFDIEFPIDQIINLPNKQLSPAEVGQVLFRHFDNYNINNIINDLNETAKSLNRIKPVEIEEENNIINQQEPVINQEDNIIQQEPVITQENNIINIINEIEQANNYIMPQEIKNHLIDSKQIEKDCELRGIYKDVTNENITQTAMFRDQNMISTNKIKYKKDTIKYNEEDTLVPLDNKSPFKVSKNVYENNLKFETNIKPMNETNLNNFKTTDDVGIQPFVEFSPYDLCENVL